ncbi:Serine/threonine-protein phosphatase PGAM5, mitochondrial [Orchesella cincta]|uniref:Serine/threonine-protein phosphatase PGAM5, mitochondrial n=1 Tax=Orchesella cincta TaxID=48709 RepID=A0A1D2MWN5_ORCCI|nr:Serine/threonine-protein phosphatase PGAM5, mitochondrial [Orchesella cincta]
MRHHPTNLLRYWKWIGGAVAGASVSLVVANNCTTSASSPWTPTKPSNVPDSFGKWDYNWDKREPYSLLKKPKRTQSKSDGATGGGDQASCDNDISEQLEKQRAKATRHIFLIRHGQYNTSGETDKEQGLTSPVGESQAQLTGKRLKDSGINFTSFTSSYTRRAIQTAEVIWKELEQDELTIDAHDPLLLEGYPCSPEPPVGGAHPITCYYEDGPRIEAAFRKYFHRASPEQEEDSFEIVVCHANVIRYCVCRALQFPGEAWHRLSLYNCSITFLSILPSGRVVLRAFGDVGHMPGDLHTTKYAVCD